MDIALLWLAVIFFLSSMGSSLVSLRSSRRATAPLHAVGLAAGWLLLTAWLILRGQAEGSCPMNSLFDVLIFLAWSVGLIFLLVGPAYRLSLMGAFTAPLALVLLLAALLLPISRDPVARAVPNPLIELHGGLSLIAYGCFGLAGVAGGMYLIQERQLKSGRFPAMAQHLPPISDLATVNRLLVAWGLGLLTAAFAAGLVSGLHVHGIKFWASAGIWLAYVLMWVSQRLWPASARRFAALSVGIFAAALALLPAIQHFSRMP